MGIPHYNMNKEFPSEIPGQDPSSGGKSFFTFFQIFTQRQIGNSRGGQYATEKFSRGQTAIHIRRSDYIIRRANF